jgi:hypothetical protein
MRLIGHRKVSCAVHAAFAEITKNSLEEAFYMSTLLKGFSWINIFFGPSIMNLDSDGRR